MKIFISYRREDSAGHTGRLYDSLQAHFGQESLFMDLVAIESGENFVDAIEGAVGSSDVLIAVIGTQWLTCTGRDGRRLDDPRDFVRAELAAALARRTPVIPVLVEGARMPPAEALPDPLKPLATHHAHEVSDQRWSYDVGRLIQAIEKRAGTPSRLARRTRLSLAAAAALIAILGAVLVFRSLQSPEGPQDAGAYYSRGTQYLASGDYDRAIADLDMAITLGGRAESYYNRGLAYYSKNDVDSAIANWNDAINLDPREARAFRQRGNAYSVKGTYDLAVADYNRAIELDPKEVRTYYNRGLLFKARNETAKAIADFEAVLTLAGDRDAERDARAQLAELRETAKETPRETAPAAPAVHLAGEWSAEITYFRNSTYTENFRFKLDGNEVLGTASFLGSRRGILEGTLNGDRVQFSTRTQVCTGDCSDPKDLEHRYRGRIAGDVITFDYMQIEDGVPAVPIEFAARRVSGSATTTPD